MCGVLPKEYARPALDKQRLDELVEFELGLIAKGWEIRAIGNLAANKTKVVHPDEVDKHFLFIGLEHMPKRSIALDSWGCSLNQQ